jgi:hypothetical protein
MVPALECRWLRHVIARHDSEFDRKEAVAEQPKGDGHGQRQLFN